MTESTVRQLAQREPSANIAQQYGEACQRARKHLLHMIAELKEIDGLAKTLQEYGMTVSVDLGPIGNAAAAARRDLEREKPSPTFRLPT